MNTDLISCPPPPSGARIEEYGRVPHNHWKETEQFNRVLKIVRSSLEELGDWAVVLMNFEYAHHPGIRIENDHDWRGQFDIVLLAATRMIILELKAQKLHLLVGRSDERRWWRRSAAGIVLPCRSYFHQVSEQRAFFLQDYLNSFKERNAIPEPNHYVVDARLVLLPGSDLSHFYHKVPVDYPMDKFDADVLDHIENDEDRRFVQYSYSGESMRPEFLRLRRLSSKGLQRLNDIWIGSGLTPKTAKWFKLITEDKLADDLRMCGSDMFKLTLDQARTIAADFGLT